MNKSCNQHCSSIDVWHENGFALIYKLDESIFKSFAIFQLIIKLREFPLL